MYELRNVPERALRALPKWNFLAKRWLSISARRSTENWDVIIHILYDACPQRNRFYFHFKWNDVFKKSKLKWLFYSKKIFNLKWNFCIYRKEFRGNHATYADAQLTDYWIKTEKPTLLIILKSEEESKIKKNYFDTISWGKKDQDEEEMSEEVPFSFLELWIFVKSELDTRIPEWFQVPIEKFQQKFVYGLEVEKIFDICIEIQFSSTL